MAVALLIAPGPADTVVVAAWTSPLSTTAVPSLPVAPAEDPGGGPGGGSGGGDSGSGGGSGSGSDGGGDTHVSGNPGSSDSSNGGGESAPERENSGSANVESAPKNEGNGDGDGKQGSTPRVDANLPKDGGQQSGETGDDSQQNVAQRPPGEPRQGEPNATGVAGANPAPPGTPAGESAGQSDPNDGLAKLMVPQPKSESTSGPAENPLLATFGSKERPDSNVVSGSAPMKADPGAEEVVGQYRKSLPEDQQGAELDMSTAPVDQATRESIVTAAGGDVVRVNEAITDFGGPNAKVTKTPILINDNAGQAGQTTLFTVTDDKGRTQLVDTRGAYYSDYTDYLRNNDLDGKWTIAHPASLTGAEGADPTQLMSGPAHQTGPVEGIAQRVDSVAQPAAAVATAATLGAGAVTAVSGGALGEAAAPVAAVARPVAAVAGVWNAGRAVYNLWNRAQHGRTLSPTDPQALGAYLNVVGGGAAGAAKVARYLGAERFAKGAEELVGISGTANQTAQLHQDWNSLSPEEQATRAADLISDQGGPGIAGSRSGPRAPPGAVPSAAGRAPSRPENTPDPTGGLPSRSTSPTDGSSAVGRIAQSPTLSRELDTIYSSDPKLKAQYERDSTSYSSELSREAFESVVKGRNQIRIAPGSQVSKVISPAEAQSRIDGTYKYGVDRLRGSIARQSDVTHLTTPQKLREGLALDDSRSIAAAKAAREKALAEGRKPDDRTGEWTPIKKDAKEAYQIRWNAPKDIADRARVPYGGPNGENIDHVRDVLDGLSSPNKDPLSTGDRPFTGTGTTPEGIPEWVLNEGPLENGAQIVRIRDDGTEEVVADLDSKTRKWVSPGKGVR